MVALGGVAVSYEQGAPESYSKIWPRGAQNVITDTGAGKCFLDTHKRGLAWLPRLQAPPLAEFSVAEPPKICCLISRNFPMSPWHCLLYGPHLQENAALCLGF